MFNAITPEGGYREAYPVSYNRQAGTVMVIEAATGRTYSVKSADLLTTSPDVVRVSVLEYLRDDVPAEDQAARPGNRHRENKAQKEARESDERDRAGQAQEHRTRAERDPAAEGERAARQDYRMDRGADIASSHERQAQRLHGFEAIGAAEVLGCLVKLAHPHYDEEAGISPANAEAALRSSVSGTLSEAEVYLDIDAGPRA